MADVAPAAATTAGAAAAAAKAPALPPALQLLREFLRAQEQRAELYSRLSKGFRDFLDHGQEGVFARLMHWLTPAFNAASNQVIAIEACLRSDAVGRPDLAALLRQVQEQERAKLQLTLSWQALRAAHAAGRFSWQAEADRPRLQGASSAADQQRQQQQQLLSLMERVRVAADGGGDDVGTGRAADQQLQQQQQQGPSHGQVDGFMSVKPGFYEKQLANMAAAASAAEAEEQQQQQQHAASATAPAANGPCCGHGHHGHRGAEGEGEGPPDPLEQGGLEPTEAEYAAAVREALQQLEACVGSINDLLQEVRDATEELEGGGGLCDGA